MIESRIWSITHADRGLGVDMSRDEPSHIHLPRRRRVVRPDDQGISEMRAVYVSIQERREHAQPAADDA